MRLARVAVVAGALVAATDAAAEEPAPAAARRGSFEIELRMHNGESSQDEVPEKSLYPSVVVAGSVAIRDDLEVVAQIAGARTSAEWENIGGLASGLIGARTRIARDGMRGHIGGGITIPLDYSIPEADCFPPRQGGDSQVLTFGDDTGCWDRSAYRRAAIHRGGWDIWLWAPDWITAVGTARIETAAPTPMMYALEVGAGAGLAITDIHEDDRVAVMGQVAPEIGALLVPSWRVFLRAPIAGVWLDDESPILVSLEPNIEFEGGGFRLRLGLLLPLFDLGNEEVSPGLGNYKIRENKSVGITAGGAF